MNSELDFENNKPTATFENQENNLSFDAPKTEIKGTSNYEKLENLPSINNVLLIGNKTTEELGIEIPDESEIFDVSCTISLSKMTVANVSHYSEEIIKKRNEGNLIRMNCTFVENPKLNVVVILNVIDDDWTLFYPVIRGNIGEGMKTYVFRLGVGPSNATISVHAIPETEVGILTEFDIEYTYEDNQVYNANAIHQLMEVFAYEITMIQEKFEELQDRVSALENK